MQETRRRIRAKFGSIDSVEEASPEYVADAVIQACGGPSFLGAGEENEFFQQAGEGIFGLGLASLAFCAPINFALKPGFEERFLEVAAAVGVGGSCHEAVISEERIEVAWMTRHLDDDGVERWGRRFAEFGKDREDAFAWAASQLACIASVKSWILNDDDDPPIACDVLGRLSLARLGIYLRQIDRSA